MGQHGVCVSSYDIRATLLSQKELETRKFSYLFPFRKYRVNKGHNLRPQSVLWLRDVLISQSDFIIWSFIDFEPTHQKLLSAHPEFILTKRF